MNKSKLILAVTGGVILLLVLVMAFFVWNAMTAKTVAVEGGDDSDGLDTVVSRATQLSRKPVYPAATSVKAIAANSQAVVAWKDEAEKLVAKGDRAYPPTTPAAFKTFIVMDAKRLVEGFEFGPFKDYIAGGKMPETTQLDKLQRQWDDVAFITETLLKCGMKKLSAVDFAVAKVEETTEEQPKSKKGKKAKKAKSEQAKVAFDPAREAYVFTFTIAPAGFIKALNALETSERFVIVDNFTFRRERDVFAEALGGGEKHEAQQTGGRRRRRGAVVEEKKIEEDPKNAIITDPVLDPPFVVTLTVSVYDFRTLEDKKEGEVGK